MIRSIRRRDSPWLLDPILGMRECTMTARGRNRFPGIPSSDIITASMIVARRFLIGGRVQGVGFRMFAEARATAEGVQGYVRNLADGRVEALVEGDRESVDRVELALRRGPGGAHVESFDVEDMEPTRRTIGFTTR
jgi:acylphosphatase